MESVRLFADATKECSDAIVASDFSSARQDVLARLKAVKRAQTDLQAEAAHWGHEVGNLEPEEA
jgi:hypothetical protein